MACWCHLPLLSDLRDYVVIMMVITLCSTFLTNINIMPNFEFKLWTWKGDIVDVIMSKRLTSIQTNLTKGQISSILQVSQQYL